MIMIIEYVFLGSLSFRICLNEVVFLLFDDNDKHYFAVGKQMSINSAAMARYFENNAFEINWQRLGWCKKRSNRKWLKIYVWKG